MTWVKAHKSWLAWAEAAKCSRFQKPFRRVGAPNSIGGPLTFSLVLIEGFFDSSVRIAESSTISMTRVTGELTPLLGQQVRLAAHHLPADPIDPIRWGGGSCAYQASGVCPYGHHQDPTRMYSFSGEGVLGQSGSDWTLTRFDGVQVQVGLGFLEGHRGRVACAPLFDVEAMRDAVVSSGMGADLGADLGVRADELRSMLERLRRM